MPQQYPPDDVLIARGKYSTLNSERRALVKGLSQDMLAVANAAHRVLRVADDAVEAQVEADGISKMLFEAQIKLGRLGDLATLLADLRIVAWDNRKVDE